MISVRPATIEDMRALHALILALAEHHGQTQYVLTTPEELRRAGFGEAPRFGALLAEDAGTPVGFVSYTLSYSIWLGGPYMNIDDVFVQASHRGRGVGEALLHAARARCRELGVQRMRWEVQADNHGAIRFYERLGAAMQPKGIFRWTVD